MSEIDHELRRQVDQVRSMVINVDQAVAVVSHQVATVSHEQQEARNELAALRTDFQAFVRRHEMIANVQRAETRIGVLNDRIDHEFGHHKVVRRSAVGMLQAFDVGFVSEDTVRAVSEQLMVQTPRYWLAPVLVALAAWAADEPDLCDRAVEEAFRRSPTRTALFMALVLRRQGRRDSSVRWLKHYLDAQDPHALGRDFAVILESISQGAFGPAGLDLVREALDRWRDLLLTDEGKQAAQVTRWRAELDSHIAPPATPRFPRLAQVSPQWVPMDRVLAAAEAHQSILAKYGGLAAEEVTPAASIEDAVDDILDRLVSEYDDDELPLRRELAFQEAVIEHDGDVDLSKRAVAADSASLETRLDYLTIQTTSALNPAAIGVSRSTQRLAVAACHEWFGRAHLLFTSDYRAALPPDVEAAFEGTHNAGALAFNLPRWVGSFAQPLEVLERSLGEHWDGHTRPFVAGFAFNWGKKLVLPIAVTVVATIVLTVCLGWVGLLVGLVAGGIWALVLYNQSQAAVRRQQEAQAFVDRARTESLAQLRAAGAELTDWSSQFRHADGFEPRVREMIADLARAGHASQPFERRGIHAGGQTGF